MNKDISVVLDELAAEAPVDKADWSDVQARSRRRKGWIRSLPKRRRLMVALVAATVLGLAGTAVGVGIDRIEQQTVFHASRPDDPQRVGPLVEVASGDDWALIAWKSNVGICLDFAIPGNSPFGCGFPVRGAKSATDASGAGLPNHAVAGFVSGGGLVGGDGKTTIFGVAAHEVAAVKVELRNGRVVDASLYDAPPELDAEVGFFIVRLALPPQGFRDEGPVRAYSAYDRDRNLIDRIGD